MSSQTSEARGGHEKSIVFLDDRRDLVEIVVERLKSRGYGRVFGFTSTEDAQQFVEAHDTTVVIADWRLDGSDCDGIEFLRWVKDVKPRARCTLFTGFSMNLSGAQKGVLTKNGIALVGKGEITTDKLVRMVEGGVKRKTQVSSARGTAESDGHQIAKKQLELECMAETVHGLRRALRPLADQLIVRLERIDVDPAAPFDGYGESYSIAEMVKDLRALNPQGLHWIATYQALLGQLGLEPAEHPISTEE